ncbi:dienelactone hydrolase family protein [Ornithinimicrobium cryptoxanthini]|uniref:Dienelactone hydrolase family protein n=1 Tax=Ornithinimicrobium cryptoxanthini TaxID=2934161 RepID=A0ABY4YJ29_9MICO|nr:dienelactone hydrolase family protein [Ornithinimicrobium cryptoxanthini]USQ76515.1 dienelactone hydrolase family protein [Ornithinimicrobium cryptoxanthini]
MALEPTEVSIPTPDGAMPAQLWFPPTVDDQDRPALVVFQEIFGVSDYIRRRCEDLADLGYAVLAPEFYWRLPRQRVDESADDVLDQGMALVSQLDWDTAVRDGVAATEHLAALPHVGKVGLVGYCLGGGLAFAVGARATTPLALLVSYYGSALPQLVQAGVQVNLPSLHHFGTADAYIPMEQVAQIRDWVSQGHDDVRFKLHEGAGHAFDNPHPMFRHKAASRDAWRQTAKFLRKRLPVT